jgi:DNA-binding NtrC family response regulator
MRKALLSVVLVLWGLAPASSEGCGDKFLRVGRGARFQRGYVALHPARILLFTEARSPLAAALRELEPVLQRAGHKTLRVEDHAGLSAALRTERYQLVMADLAGAVTVQEHTRGRAVQPSILPVIQGGLRDAAAAAERQFNCFVTAPGKKSNVLAEIDGVMERHLKDKGDAASPTDGSKER